MGFDFGLNRTKWAGMNHEMSVYLQSLLEKNNYIWLVYTR